MTIEAIGCTNASSRALLWSAFHTYTGTLLHQYDTGKIQWRLLDSQAFSAMFELTEYLPYGIISTEVHDGLNLCMIKTSGVHVDKTTDGADLTLPREYWTPRRCERRTDIFIQASYCR